MVSPSLHQRSVSRDCALCVAYALLGWPLVPRRVPLLGPGRSTVKVLQPELHSVERWLDGL